MFCSSKRVWSTFINLSEKKGPWSFAWFSSSWWVQLIWKKTFVKLDHLCRVLGIKIHKKKHGWTTATYLSWGKGKSSSKVPWYGDMLLPKRVDFYFPAVAVTLPWVWSVSPGCGEFLHHQAFSGFSYRRSKSPSIITTPKFNIAPQKWWLEDYFPIGKVAFSGAMLNFQGVSLRSFELSNRRQCFFSYVLNEWSDFQTYLLHSIGMFFHKHSPCHRITLES